MTPPSALHSTRPRFLVAHCATLLIATALSLGWAAGVRAQGFSPEEAVKRMVVPAGLRVTCFAAEPMVRQPILVKMDARGRLWVIQYLQYPNPAGLQRTHVDRWSRTVYDRVPEPPPHGPRGADRVTILEDTDQDGIADQAHDFIDGLNLCTGLEFATDGVYILQVPYLLFYPDRDHDDRPDGPPSVVLTGFGMEDAQSLANHLTWGPDGWLYGVNGSTTTCRIRGQEFQQGVWRYHPRDDRFELFCEGGGNTFGLTFDAAGNLFYSANGGLCWHALQGGYFEKSFAKHGPLHNPYAYGFLSHVQYAGATGGPNTGGTVYLGDTFPSSYRGQFLTGDFLAHTSSSWRFSEAGSTFTAARTSVLLDAQDTWFGPTDLCVGLDGAVYISDFYDRRTAHPDPDAQWDRSNGRIYRIAPVGETPRSLPRFSALSPSELATYLSHPHAGYAHYARLYLSQQLDDATLASLRQSALQHENPHQALQALWTIATCNRCDDFLAQSLLAHPAPDIRRWMVRLLGDPSTLSPSASRAVIELSARETAPSVRSQLAASCQRFPTETSLAVLGHLQRRAPEEEDPRVRWPLWWALERQVGIDRSATLAWLHSPSYPTGTSADWLRGLLVRRLAAAGTRADDDACHSILSRIDMNRHPELLTALGDGLQERARPAAGIGQGALFENSAVPPTAGPQPADPVAPRVSAALQAWIEQHWQNHPDELPYLRLALAADLDAAHDHVYRRLQTEPMPPADLGIYLKLLLEHGRSGCQSIALRFVASIYPAEVQSLALDLLQRHVDEESCRQLLDRYPDCEPLIQPRIRGVLLGSRVGAALVLEQVEQERWAAAEILVSELRQVAAFADPQLDARVQRIWGNIRPGTPEEKLATMRRLANDLRADLGDFDSGRQLFRQHCAPCHQLFGEGKMIGPDLSNANRGDQEFLLTSLVDPSAVIRQQYLVQVIETQAGTVHAGLVIAQDAASITLLDGQQQAHRIPRDQIESQTTSSESLMPERLLEQLAPQQVRDLFHYLQQAADDRH